MKVLNYPNLIGLLGVVLLLGTAANNLLYTIADLIIVGGTRIIVNFNFLPSALRLCMAKIH